MQTRSPRCWAKQHPTNPYSYIYWVNNTRIYRKIISVICLCLFLFPRKINNLVERLKKAGMKLVSTYYCNFCRCYSQSDPIQVADSWSLALMLAARSSLLLQYFVFTFRVIELSKHPDQIIVLKLLDFIFLPQLRR